MGIRARRTLDAERLGSLLVGDDSGGATVIDLAEMTFCTPGGLVAIATTIESAHRARRKLHFIKPESMDCQRYLSRMKVREMLVKYYATPFGLPEVTSHDAPSLSELRHFEGSEDMDGVAQTLMDLYRAAGGATPEPLYQSLNETASNAVEHSGVGGGWIALQMYPARDEVVVATADSGVGLKATLGVATDQQAIVRAARLHESSSGQAGRGRGITSVVELTSEYGGHVIYVTGSAYGKFTKGSWEPHVASTAVPFEGTLAEMRIGRRRQG